MAEIAVIGAGAWGTALATIFARNGHRTRLCVRREDQRGLLAATRENAAYLPGVALPESLAIGDCSPGAVSTAEIVVVAIPSRFARAALAQVAPAIRRDAIVVSATKGIEVDSLKTMTQMLAEIMPRGVRLAALSGPGFAAEIARGKPAALVAAAQDEETARRVQEALSNRSLRVYRSTDVIGVELAGAAKNVIAIAAGVSDGLDLGSSARAALVTRGLAEITRLGRAMGARGDTIAGLAGLGDLVLTCTGDLSRNRNAGMRIARGERQPIDGGGAGAHQPVAEGIDNARAILGLAGRHGVEMPIVAAVNRLLYEGGEPAAMVEELMTRELKAEF